MGQKDPEFKLKVRTESLPEARYLLERAIRTRGISLLLSDGSFACRWGNVEFELSFMPGNRRILVSHGVVVEEKHRGKGLGKQALKLREQLAREAGVNLLLATVRNDNLAEIHILKSAGWRRPIKRQIASLWYKKL